MTEEEIYLSAAFREKDFVRFRDLSTRHKLYFLEHAFRSIYMKVKSRSVSSEQKMVWEKYLEAVRTGDLREHHLKRLEEGVRLGVIDQEEYNIAKIEGNEVRRNDKRFGRDHFQ